MTQFLPPVRFAYVQMRCLHVRRDGDGNAVVAPVYRVPAWRVPNEDGAELRVRLRRAYPGRGMPAPWLEGLSEAEMRETYGPLGEMG